MLSSATVATFHNFIGSAAPTAGYVAPSLPDYSVAAWQLCVSPLRPCLTIQQQLDNFVFHQDYLDRFVWKCAPRGPTLLARLIVLMVRRRSWGQRSGLQDSVTCALCSQGTETIDHLLLAPGVMVASLSEVRGQSLTQSFWFLCSSGCLEHLIREEC
jgi:hypothetical protein